MEQRNSIFNDVFVAAAVAVAVAVVVAEAPFSSKISQSLIYTYVAEMNTRNIHRGSLVTLCCYKHPNKMRVLMITWILYVRMLLVMMFAACV